MSKHRYVFDDNFAVRDGNLYKPVTHALAHTSCLPTVNTRCKQMWMAVKQKIGHVQCLATSLCRYRPISWEKKPYKGHMSQM